MLKKQVVAVLFTVFVCFPVYKVSSSENVLNAKSRLDFVLKSIKENEKSLKTFTAKIIQERESPLLRDTLRSKGMIYFDHDGKILVKFTKPSQMLILLKDGTLVVYYPDLSKVMRRYIGGNFIEKYFGIGEPVDRLCKQYFIQLMDKGDSDRYHLKLIPRDNSFKKHIESIEVTINPQNWLPEEIDIKEYEEDRTVLHLNFCSINKPLPKGIFAISLPEDYDNLH